MAEKKALLTIVHTEGSTWQKVGARLVLSEDGTMDQMLTGGCLEQHLKESAPALCHGENRLLTFDMREEEDALFGWGSGCGGKMVILVEPFSASEEKCFQKDFLDQSEENLRSYSIEFIDSNLVRGRIYLDQENQGGVDIPKAKILYAYAIAPRAKVLIFGAGPDGSRLSKFTKDLGFITHLFDHRESISHAEKFDPNEVSRLLNLQRPDIVVVMTHNFLVDQKILKGLGEIRPLRILLLGPVERKNALLEGSDCFDLDQLIEAPLGLVTKARGSEEVALSASASLLDFWKKRTEIEIKKISPEKVLQNLGIEFSPKNLPKRVFLMDGAPAGNEKSLSCPT